MSLERTASRSLISQTFCKECKDNTLTHLYLSVTVCGWCQRRHRHLKIRCAHLHFFFSVGRLYVDRKIRVHLFPGGDTMWVRLVVIQMFPCAGGIDPCRTSSFCLNLAGGQSKSRSAIMNSACWLSRSCCWVLRVVVSVFACVCLYHKYIA